MNVRHVVLTLALGLCPALAKDAPGLTAANFVDIADAVADMLDTSGLTYSTMVLDAASVPQAGAVHARFQPPAPLGDVRTIEAPCSGGGSVQLIMRDADASGDLSTDDRFVTRFHSCVLDRSVVTGRSEFVVVAHRFEGRVEITELDFRFKDLGTPELRWTGPARVVLRTDLQRGTERYQVNYRDLTVMRGPHSMRWNFELVMTRPPMGDQVASVNGAMAMDGLQLQLRQDEPYAITSSGIARSGQLTASDARGARLQVEAGRWRYAYRLFLAGNRGEVPDAASQSKPYNKR